MPVELPALLVEQVPDHERVLIGCRIQAGAAVQVLHGIHRTGGLVRRGDGERLVIDDDRQADADDRRDQRHSGLGHDLQAAQHVEVTGQRGKRSNGRADLGERLHAVAATRVLPDDPHRADLSARMAGAARGCGGPAGGRVPAQPEADLGAVLASAAARARATTRS